MVRKKMIGLAAAAIVTAASTTGASAQTCRWVNSPIFLPRGGVAYGQVWDCSHAPARGAAKNGETVQEPLQCENWRHTRTMTRFGMRDARWCPGTR
jgi:hypothetical protein